MTGRIRIVVVADDLIWADRLLRIARAAGEEATLVRSLDALRAAVAGGEPVIVDLTARAHDGLAAVAEARAVGCPVLAVAQHDDRELHRRARAAGAERVVPYRLLHERGAEIVGAWLGSRGRGSSDMPAPEDAAVVESVLAPGEAPAAGEMPASTR